MVRFYTEQEKEEVLEQMGIQPLNGMLNSKQAAQVLSKRAEIETGDCHKYDDNAVRWRVKSGKLKVATKIHNRMSLFSINDIFALDLEPQKWHEKRRKRDKPETQQTTEEAA